MSQILIEEAVTPIGKKYSGLPSLKTFIKKCDSLIHCDLRKGLLLKFNVYKVARMLQIKRLKFITKCRLRDPGAKREHEGVITMRGNLKLKLEPNGNLQPPAAAETKERWFLHIRRPFSSFSPPAPPPRLFIIDSYT